jgi:hypothetical protein
VSPARVLERRKRLAARLRFAILSVLIRWALRFLRRTVRIVAGPGATELLEAFAANRRVVVAFWHGQLVLVQLAYPGRNMCIQVSRHADGELIARAVEPLGIRSARGSATRGGVASVREMLRAYEEGFDLAVAVDGPRGPLHRVKPGALRLGAATGAPIYPVAGVPKRALVFRSWDRFTVPLPFTQIFYAVGEPLRVPRDASDETLEELRVALEDRLVALTRSVHDRAGRGEPLAAIGGATEPPPERKT